MKMKKYTITLDTLEVEKAEKIIEPYGGKLSTLINELLKAFNNSEWKKK